MPKAEKIKVNVKDCVNDNSIDLSLSELTEVPVRDIASFKRVTILDLSNNKLMSLGKNFPSLVNIYKLDLSRNQIKFLPEDFGNLRNLRHLDLYNNKLEHLPLSFGNLTNLRYLDLKGNPLTPALAKVVGLCLTAKDCNISAKNTVKCMARMQEEVEKAKQKLELENEANIEVIENVAKDQEAQKSKKAKKPKSKLKKTKVENASPKPTPNLKLAKSKLEGTTSFCNVKPRKSSTALKTILTFIILLAINVFVIYIIMFKNPEIVEKLVEFIPHQYRDWILTKSEYFRLCVSDWIQNFRTPPERN